MHHSRLGILAFILAITTIVVFVITFILGYLHRGGTITLPDPGFEIVVKLTILCSVVFVIGFILAVVAVFKKGTRKLLPSIAIAVDGGVLLFLIGLTLVGRETPGRLTGVTVVDFGTYAKRSSMALSDDYSCVQHSDTIVAKLGTRFGLRYTVNGDPPRGVFELERVRLYPPPGMWDSTSGSYQTRVSYKVSGRTGETNFMGYVFDRDTELKLGVWTFQLWSDGKKFVERQFVIVPE